MPDYRCPKHDQIFNATIDTRVPGSAEDKARSLSAHPVDGHPECPLCVAEGTPKKSK